MFLNLKLFDLFSGWFFALNCVFMFCKDTHFFDQSIRFYCYFMTKCILSSWYFCFHVLDTVHVCACVCVSECRYSSKYLELY